MSLASSVPVQIGSDVTANLVRFCKARRLDRFTLVADHNTYPVLGEAVERALKRHGFQVKAVVLAGEEIIPDERSIVQVLVRTGRESQTYLAVGSGTITDITRFASHRTKDDFISIPTAPSVDGYTSPGSSLVIDRLKQTVVAHPPIAVFADLPTLCAAPRPMIAAGFADMLGKYTALADWQLGHLLWDEPYSESVARRVGEALQGCLRHSEAIGLASEDGIRELMAGLLESGLCMLEFGNSRPAAGAEHYVSHYLEMKLLRDNRPAILHGAKVGLATLLIAGRYERLRQLVRQEAIDRLKVSLLPDRAQEVRRILAAYGPIGEKVVAEQAPFLDLTADAHDRLKHKIVDRWPEIQAIAATVPSPQTLADLLRTVGGPIEPAAIGLSDEELALALDCSHYLRNRFTILKLHRILGI
jgi:glycerol-1-phosphate dehydrogenase [NAD(P)+]